MRGGVSGLSEARRFFKFLVVLAGRRGEATFQLFLRRDGGIGVRADIVSTWTTGATAHRDLRWFPKDANKEGCGV